MPKMFTTVTRFTVADEDREFFRSNTCRELLISHLSHVIFPGVTNVRLGLQVDRRLNPRMIEEIVESADVAYHYESGALSDAFSTYDLLLIDGEQEKQLETLYWLILGERLEHYYKRNFSGMLRSSESYDWYYGEKTASIEAWKRFKGGDVVPTSELLRYHCGPIDYYKRMR